MAININEYNLTTIISDDYNQNQFLTEIKLFAGANGRASDVVFVYITRVVVAAPSRTYIIILLLMYIIFYIVITCNVYYPGIFLNKNFLTDVKFLFHFEPGHRFNGTK